MKDSTKTRAKTNKARVCERTNRNDALVAGDLDTGYVGVVPALISKSQQADFVIVASANLEGSAIVAKPEIQNIQDLNGKTVGTPGIGTIQASLLYMVQKEFDITVNANTTRTHRFAIRF